ncbi:MAG: GntR family transcriptional regulator [Roseovarius sp.]|nr:GntR family transcriptional regulator [Roseovarius sp.]MCY4291062.1 GntR family transcriptional regulator [Roseovarius sp.]MCY4315877.1 GntR family transcriptional regulator [Roseovarius sp.]
MAEKIERTTLAEKAYQQLRAGLASATFGPGEVLKIRSLADQYGISPTPIREALQRLVAENALKAQANRSFSVPILTRTRFEEIITMRMALEPIASRQGMVALKKRDIRELDLLTEDMYKAIKKSDVRIYLEGNRQFHFIIYEKSESPLLLGVIKDLWVLAAPYFIHLFAEAAYVEQCNDWHRRISRAIKDGNADAMAKGICDDISAARDTLLKHMD